MAAGKYLRYALDRYGQSVGAALAEYNGGPKAAKAFLKTGDPGNAETRNYVQRVLSSMSGAPATSGSITDTTTQVTPATRELAPTQDSLFSLDGYAPISEVSPSTNLDVNLDTGLEGMQSDALAERIENIVEDVFRG
jgi:hypothetical protein